MQSEDSINSYDINKDEEETNIEDSKRLLEEAKEEGRKKPEKFMSTYFYKIKDEGKKKESTSNRWSEFLDVKENDKQEEEEYEIEKEYVPSEDNVKRNDANEDKEETNREDANRLLEEATEEGWNKPEKLI